jgi:hypothetical protein
VIYLLLVIGILAACAAIFYTCDHVSKFVVKLLEMHETALESSVEKLDAMAAAVQDMAATTASANREALNNMVAAHADSLKQITQSHGVAAEHLSAVTAAHHAAATSSADSTVQLRQAAENLATLLADSNLTSINEHLSAIRRFMLPRS